MLTIAHAFTAELLFICEISGRNPMHSENHSPTPGISPKWVNRLFLVILWPAEVVSKTSLKH